MASFFLRTYGLRRFLRHSGSFLVIPGPGPPLGRFVLIYQLNPRGLVSLSCRVAAAKRSPFGVSLGVERKRGRRARRSDHVKPSASAATRRCLAMFDPIRGARQAAGSSAGSNRRTDRVQQVGDCHLMSAIKTDVTQPCGAAGPRTAVIRGFKCLTALRLVSVRSARHLNQGMFDSKVALTRSLT